MASTGRFSLVYLSLTAVITGAFLAIAETTASTFRSCVDYLVSDFLVWPDFQPAASVSLELDRMSHEATIDLPRIAARFRSFVARALRHDLFDGQRFDPGRQPA